MELVKILSSVVKESVSPRLTLTEISNKLMNQLLDKFSKETSAEQETIKQ
jgi:hypothetical protein